MNIQRFLRFSTVMAAFVLLAVMLAGCRLPASQGIEGDSTQYPVPGGTEQGMGDLDVILTQTAMALLTPQPPPATAPPQAPAVTETPAPAPTQPPQPTAVVAYVEATPGKPPATYVLQAGEFPFCIARRFNVDQYELLNINGLGLRSNVYPGTTLRIPQTGNPFVGDRSLLDHPTTYKIKTGDTIYKIACIFGDVSPDMIALQNNLQAPFNLNAGEVLIIP
jgi:LysM repeat protein